MASIRLIPEQEATGKVKDIYEEIKSQLGINFVPAVTPNPNKVVDLNKKRGLIFMGLVLLTVFINGAALARILSFNLDNWAVANGGGNANGGNFPLDETIGQSSTAAAAGGSDILRGGFWGTGDSNSNDYRIFLPLTIDSRPKFTDGADTLTLENRFVRVVVDKIWGGAIREIWFGGENLVNNFDGGRLIGVSLYDSLTVPPSLDIADPDWGWNPTPSDIYDHENRPLAYSYSDGVLYVKVRNLHWNPNNKGGGPATAVPSDVLVETWIDLPATARSGVHVKYRVTHDGGDYHPRFTQELGYVYVQPAYSRFVRYTGDMPWTNGPVEIQETPRVWPATGQSAVTEYWGGFVNANDFGLILWAPQAYPNFYHVFHENSPPSDNSTAYMVPLIFMEHDPGIVYEAEQYLFAGRWQDARAQIYSLRQELGPIPDVLPGFGNIDVPVSNATVSGVIDVDGWAVDDRGIQKVEVLLDGQIVGQAQYGLLRDIENDYPGFPDRPYVGFLYQLNTALYPNGAHVIAVQVTDTAGHSSQILPGEVEIFISN